MLYAGNLWFSKYGFWLPDRGIARSLRLAEATVKRHLANLYPKIGVGSRGEATRKALSEGWISTWDMTQE